MWKELKEWFGGASNHTEAGQRLFSIFDVSEASSDALFGQIESDLHAWGYDSFQSRQAAKRIVEKATQSAAPDIHEAAEHADLIDAVHANDGRTLERLAAERGDGVTAEDIRWYWSRHPVARAAMIQFDEELRGRMWIDRHVFHICLDDLEQDVKRRLPVFGDPIVEHTDSPLPLELKRRFTLFITRIRRNPSAFEKWSSRLQHASSMNALIRELIVSQDF
jgi:hypothetical protein